MRRFAGLRACVLGLSFLAFLAFLASVTSGSALAQAPADPQRALTAQALYEQATSEMDAGAYAAACPKLEEVTRLIPDGLGAKLTLAQCYEEMGRLASAWAQYALVEALASKAGQTARAQSAAEKAAALKPRLAQLTVEVPSEVRAIPGLAITGDGVPVGEPQWGMPLPVLRHKAVTLGDGSTGAFIAGAAVLAGGVVLLATAPSQKSSQPKAGATKRASARPKGGAETRGPRASLELSPARIQVNVSW